MFLLIHLGFSSPPNSSPRQAVGVFLGFLDKTIKKQYPIGEDAAENVIKPFLEYTKEQKRDVAVIGFIVNNEEKLKPTLESLNKVREEKHQAIKKQTFEIAANKRDEEKEIMANLITLIIKLAKGKRTIKTEWILKYFADHGIQLA